jgi:succinate-semialdehyde dehydrogenase/glutarate-semialdehyde dehydrogenase
MELADPSLLRRRALIAGSWVEGSGQHPVHNPADRSLLGTVPRLAAADVDRAIASAHDARDALKEMGAVGRARILGELFALMNRHSADLATLITYEQGKPLKEAKAEIAYSASFIQWFAEEARRIYGSTIPGHRPDLRLLVTREPVGVCAGITPWNFPSAMITRKLGAALAAGCPMLLKPAEDTPLSALALAELCQRAGVPSGAINTLTGDRSDAETLGKALTRDPRVRKISFTGSTTVGKKLMADCAATVKRVSLELGGNAPFIVFDDSDVDAAVDGAMVCKFRNCGQTCVSANRFFVQRGVYTEFSEKLAERIRKLRVGPGNVDGNDIGPLISPRAVEKVERHVDDALRGGASLVLGGRRSSEGDNFFQPTLLTEVSGDALMFSEETFGPVAGLLGFDDEQEAIALANATRAGLAAYFYARDHGRIVRVSEGLEYGMVGVNTGLVSTAVAPFGGVKESGLGREGSRFGLDDYLEYKYQCVGGIFA